MANLKSLLTISTAALIISSPVYAADPVLAEPEPMDYVRVCDMYGAGFFYIPGTETCLKISGYVDAQYEYSQYDADLVARNIVNGVIVDQNGILTGDSVPTRVDLSESVGEPVYLARVNFDAREETDWGTLRSYIRLEGEGTNEGGASVIAKDVFIELGGLSTGYRTTALETGGLFGLMLDGYYGGGRHMYMNYTWAGNGFAVMAGADLDNGADLETLLINSLNNPFGSTWDLRFSDDWDGSTYGDPGGDGKSVNPYIVASYTGSMFTLRGKYGHDSSAGASHYGVDGSVTPWTGLSIRGYWEGNSDVNEYAFSGDYTSFYPGVQFCHCSRGIDTIKESYDLYAEQTWGAGIVYQVMPNVSLAGGYSASSFFDPSSSDPGGDLTSYVFGLDWNPVDNLVLRVNYRHQDWSKEDLDAEADELRVRLRRTF